MLNHFGLSLSCNFLFTQNNGLLFLQSSNKLEVMELQNTIFFLFVEMRNCHFPHMDCIALTVCVTSQRIVAEVNEKLLIHRVL